MSQTNDKCTLKRLEIGLFQGVKTAFSTEWNPSTSQEKYAKRDQPKEKYERTPKY